METKKAGLLRAIIVHTIAFLGGAVLAAILLGSVFYVVLNTAWLRDLGGVSAVISVVSGFYVSYRAANYLREWIYHWLDPHRYGIGLMLVHLTIFIFLGSMGWQIVLKTLLLQRSPPFSVAQAAQHWQEYDHFQLQGIRLPQQLSGHFTTAIPKNSPPRYQHIGVSPLIEGQDTLWLGFSVETTAAANDSLFRHPASGYAFWKKMAWVEQSLYEQAILQTGVLSGAPHRILQGEALSLDAYKQRIYRWILPFIGIGWLVWMLGVLLAMLFQRRLNNF